MSFNVALSGIQAATSELSIVGNNVANASTHGFKNSKAVFADVYAATALGTGSTPIGNGVNLAEVAQQFSQGTLATTANNLHLGIKGNGFFVLKEAGTQVYSRAGLFKVDNQGFVVSPTNQKLQGFLADSNGNISGATGDVTIDVSNIPPQQTATVTAGLNFDSRAAVPSVAWVGTPVWGGTPPAAETFNKAYSAQIYDSLGNQHSLKLYAVKTATANEWDMHAQIDGVDVDASPAAAPFTQVFNADGSFNAGASEAITLSWSPLDNTGNPNGATTPQTVTIDVSGSTQHGSGFATLKLVQDGYATGRLSGVDIDAGGIIFGRYNNGQSRKMGQVMLAGFPNANGLQPIGNTSWGETFDSGLPLIGEPNTGSLGVLQAGALEESNVDLTAELVKMIIAQRNFQANAQTIRTADAVTQTIINLR